MEVAHTATIMVVSILGPWLVQWLDKRRMAPQARRRTWGVATWGAALYAFGPLSMLGWVFVTRPFPRRIVAAVPWTLAGFVPLLGVEAVFAALKPPASDPFSMADLAVELVVVAAAVVILMLIIEGIVRTWRLLRGRPAPGRSQ